MRVAVKHLVLRVRMREMYYTQTYKGACAANYLE